LLNVAAGLVEPTEGDISVYRQGGRRPNSIFWEDLASNLWDKSLILFGRGSWIRTNDLQYPKLPRYQAALYPDHLGNVVDTRFKRCQQG
jgi:hypothetical protein